MYFGLDRNKFIIILIAIMVLGAITTLNSTSAILGLLISVPGVLLAITFHEFAHAFVAYKLGDDTPKLEGRLSLNPFSHMDPVGMVLLLFAGFGWGKPVEVNPRNFNRDITVDKANAIVSIAGPAANFILAIVLTFIYGALIKFASVQIYSSYIMQIVMAIIHSAIIINIGLGVFNLIPLPPLDGSKVIKPFLPYNAKVFFENNESIFYIIFIIIWLTGIASMFITPLCNSIYNLLLKFVGIFF